MLFWQYGIIGLFINKVNISLHIIKKGKYNINLGLINSKFKAKVVGGLRQVPVSYQIEHVINPGTVTSIYFTLLMKTF